ncbi:hypothetical protein PFAS1_06370 [Pseudomonas frederiksbergensis]|nr:hypothetical protein PFAS1_06370 [Pseudomonas frederiksbergensis]
MSCTDPVGAGLLAKAECQSTSMVNVRPHSRASPLPQGDCVCSRSLCLLHSPGRRPWSGHPPGGKS